MLQRNGRAVYNQDAFKISQKVMRPVLDALLEIFPWRLEPFPYGIDKVDWKIFDNVNNQHLGYLEDEVKYPDPTTCPKTLEFDDFGWPIEDIHIPWAKGVKKKYPLGTIYVMYIAPTNLFFIFPVNILNEKKCKVIMKTSSRSRNEKESYWVLPKNQVEMFYRFQQGQLIRVSP